MTSISRIEISHHRLPLDPPFPASWDPEPRRYFPVSLVRVFDDRGRVGVGAGDPLHGFAGYESLFIGEDPLELDRHHEVLSNIDFHAGRPWPFDVALWDLAGQIEDRPLWHLLGGGRNRVRAYLSTGVARTESEMVAVARGAVARGFPAIKVRFGRPSLADDLAVVGAIRDAVGDALELLVDCNQGWRMPWDTGPPWDVDLAAEVGAELEAAGVYWMEEPLHRGDYAGLAELRRRVSVRVAGGELTRERHEFAELLAHDCLDVYQPDCVCTQGIGGLRRVAAAVVAAGKVFTPHTWGNGIGLLANAHLAAGTIDAPFLEYPYDPPEWTPDRRDFLLADPIDVDGDGWITLSERPGLGVMLDEEALARTASSAVTYR